MKKILAIIAALLCLSSPVEAIKQVNSDMIRGAQEYGQRFATQDAETFLLPWTVYAENTRNVSEISERGYIYTPYLLIALNAKDKTVQGLPVRLADSEKILTDYNGFITFEVILFGTSSDFASGITSSLHQDKNRTEAHQVILSSNTRIAGKYYGENLYRAQYYIYFLDKGVNIRRALKLTVSGGDNSERHFIYNLTRIP